MNIDNIEPISSKDFGNAAQRPKYSVLDNYNWTIEGHEKLRKYNDASNEYMKLIIDLI